MNEIVKPSARPVREFSWNIQLCHQLLALSFPQRRFSTRSGIETRYQGSAESRANSGEGNPRDNQRVRAFYQEWETKPPHLDTGPDR